MIGLPPVTSIATITPSTASLSCHPGDGAVLTFVIAPKVARRLAAGLRLVPGPGLAAGWLHMDSPAERPLVPGSDITVMVTLTVPDDAAPARLTLALLVYDLAEPGEIFEQSQLVAVDIAARVVVAPPPPRVMRRRSWLRSSFFAVLVMLLILIGTLIIGLFLNNTFPENDDFDLWQGIVFWSSMPLAAVLLFLAVRLDHPTWFCLLGHVLPLAWVVLILTKSSPLVVLGLGLAVGYGYLFWRQMRRVDW